MDDPCGGPPFILGGLVHIATVLWGWKWYVRLWKVSAVVDLVGTRWAQLFYISAGGAMIFAGLAIAE